MGLTGKRVEKSGIGGTARTNAGAGLTEVPGDLPGDGTDWHVQAAGDMRCTLCVGFALYYCFSFTTLEQQEPSNWDVAYTKQVRFGGLDLLDALFASTSLICLLGTAYFFAEC